MEITIERIVVSVLMIGYPDVKERFKALFKIFGTQLSYDFFIKYLENIVELDVDLGQGKEETIKFKIEKMKDVAFEDIETLI